MDEVEEKLIFDHSSEDQTNILHNTTDRSITSIENLSNELFYEILDYLDGIYIYQAFSNLNNRFQQLLISSFLLLKINYSESYSEKAPFNNWKQMMNVHRHQLYSIRLGMLSHSEEFFTSLFIINSSLNHLESLFLWEIELNSLMSILEKLPSLPRLFSLNITNHEESINLTAIYRLIFNLPMLKYYKFYTSELDLPVSLPMATDEQFTSIENLNIDHCCNFYELSAIVSYTPQLRCLKFTDDSGRKLNAGIISPIVSVNLTHVSINSYTITFYELEMFIHQIRPKLKVLHFITRSEDMEFLNGHRWEQFILHYLPQLEEFYLQCYENIDEKQVLQTYPSEPNQFNSSFWIQRQWILETEIDFDYILYSIRPYKKRWYKYPSLNSSMELSKSHRLTISDTPDVNSNELLLKLIKHILTIASIYHLEIILPHIRFNILIRIMDILFELDSLKVESIVYNEPNILFAEEHDVVLSILSKTKITKLYFEQITCVEEIFVLMSFCRNMTCLKVNHIDLTNIEFCLRNILEVINNEENKYLRSLCFRVSAVDDQIIKTLQQMINNEKLLSNYTIKRILDCIYLQWK